MTKQSRRTRAINLIAALESGPTFTDLTVQEYLEEYKIWVKGNIIPKLKDLIPELKGKEKS